MALYEVHVEIDDNNFIIEVEASHTYKAITSIRNEILKSHKKKKMKPSLWFYEIKKLK